MKEFLPDTGNLVTPKINPDSFSSFNELKLELIQLQSEIKECPLECHVIFDLIKKRMQKISDYMRYLDNKIVQPKRPPASPITHQRPKAS